MITRHVASILFGALFTIAACWSCGKLLLARLRIDLYAEELQIFRFLAGAALFSLTIFLLTACRWARDSVFLAVGAVFILAAFRVKDERRVPLPDYSTTWKFIFTGIVAVFGIYYFVNALAPESSPDGSTYHLGYVAKYLRMHGFGEVTTSIYASLPAGLEMLFLSAFAFGRHSAAALIEFSFLLVTPFAILSYSRRFGFSKAGVAAAAMVICSPVFAVSGTSAYNDAAAALIAFSLFYVLQIWDRTRQSGLLMIAGLLAGFGYAIKYTLFVASIYAAGFVAWKLYRSRQKLVVPMLVLCGCAALLILPWWIKNWITVANPFSPFANLWFPNPFVTPAFEAEYALTQRSLMQWADRPLESVVRGGSGSLLGPVFLLAPLGLLAARFREGRELLLAAGIFFLPALTNIETRFLMPAAPFLALATGVAVMRSPGAALTLTLFAALSGWPAVVSKYCRNGVWRVAEFPIAEALRRIPEEVTLANKNRDFRTVAMVERMVPKEGRIFSFATPPEAYLSRDVMIAYESAEGQKLQDALWSALQTTRAPNWLRTFRFPARAFRGVRIIQTNSEHEDLWSVAEFRLMREGREVPRSPYWKVRASPNPWDVQLAFDNNPATRWRSAQPIYNGMFIEVNMGAPTTIDSVVLECSLDQGAVRLRLEGELEPGEWKTLSDTPTDTDRVTDWNLRKAAVQALKAHRITHLLLNEGDFKAADFRRNQAGWGIRQVGRTGPYALFELQ